MPHQPPRPAASLFSEIQIIRGTNQFDPILRLQAVPGLGCTCDVPTRSQRRPVLSAGNRFLDLKGQIFVKGTESIMFGMRSRQEKQNVMFEGEICVSLVEDEHGSSAVLFRTGVDDDRSTFAQQALDDPGIRILVRHIIANRDGHFPSYRNSLFWGTLALPLLEQPRNHCRVKAE